MPPRHILLFVVAALVACSAPAPGLERDAGPEGDGDGDAPNACAEGGITSGALVFDGEDDHVTMGPAPTLGLSTFTLEAWVRRDGPGSTAGTGLGGVRIAPLITKGRGESDGSNLDCNYAFGFAGDVLAADFEDMASGGNHPVVGTRAVPVGSWHHVAASYDGSTWRLYVDGVLDTEQTVNAAPRADSIQHFGIGAALNSSGVPVGSLEGAVDEVRVWDHARSPEAIAATMYEALPSAEGLVGRWSFDGAGGGTDTAGGNHGLIEGAVQADGVPLGRGLPPQLTATIPSDGAQLDPAATELGVHVADPEGDAVSVTYHLRRLSESDDFTIAVLPDTQYYTVESRGLERYFYDQTEWIRANRDAYDIVGVIHNGDLVNNAPQLYQWGVADAAMSTLEVPENGLPDGLPYGIAVGNHDQAPLGETGNTGNFNRYFGVDRFAERAYYGGHYGGNNDESWFTFSAGGLDVIVVNLQFDTTPDPAVLAWARSIFEMHPHAFGILNAHYILTRDGNFSAQGRGIYEALRDVDNLQLMTSGHVTAEKLRTDTFGGNVIHSMVADYQALDDGGSGWMRIWEFSPASDELTVRTYSPTLDEWQTDADSEFTITVDLRGAGGRFDEVASFDGMSGAVSAALDALEPGQTYEWYAEARDCEHMVRSPVRRFTTAAQP